MAKPENIPVYGKDYYAWNYEEQTQMKHRVLRAYYRVYASKLGRSRNTLFFDCHGGCGAYIQSDGTLSYGSSILINSVAEQVFANRPFTHNHIIICERDKGYFENLNKVLKDLGIYDKRIITYNKDYNDALLDSSNKVAYRSNSTLFFIDPFGYYDTPMLGMGDLMKHFGNEILVNFMFDFLNRGISVSNIDESQLTSFFGCEDWKNARYLSGGERETFLVDLYKRKLKETTRANFVFAYRLCYPAKDQTYYYLIHATNHIDGISLMKSSFASINYGRVEYLGKRNDEMSLFDMDYYKQSELANLLNKKFTGKTFSFIEILESIIEDTASLEKDLRGALKEMEKRGEVSIRRIDSAKTGLKGKDEVTFKGVKDEVHN